IQHVEESAPAIELRPCWDTALRGVALLESKHAVTANAVQSYAARFFFIDDGGVGDGIKCRRTATRALVDDVNVPSTGLDDDRHGVDPVRGERRADDLGQVAGEIIDFESGDLVELVAQYPYVANRSATSGRHAQP